MRRPCLVMLVMLVCPAWVPAVTPGWVLVTTGAAVPAMASGGDGRSGDLVGKAGCRAQGRAVPCGEGDIDPTNITDPINVTDPTNITDPINVTDPKNNSDPVNGTDPTNVIYGGSRYGASYRADYGAAYGVTSGVDYGVSDGVDYGVANGTGNGTGSAGTELSVLHRSLLAVLATLLISAAAPLGAVLLLCGRCPSMQRGLLQLLLALGAGALSGDAMLHLLPQFLELHVHEEAGQEEHTHEHTRVQPWQLLVVLAAIFCFFLMERSLRIAGRGAKCWGGAAQQQRMELSEEGGGGDGRKEQPPHSALSDDELQRNVLQALPLLLTLGDALHNAADGVALGAAFSASWRSGVGTAVAVLLHELPHELGDMAALLRSGLSAGRAVLLNAVAALPALIGVGAGLAIGTDAEALRWVCGAAAGIFLYVALCDMMPALLQERSSRPWLLLGLHCLGLISGWAALAGLALLEDSGAL